MSIRTIAKSIGTAERKTLTLSAPIHTAWKRAGDSRKAEIVAEFKVGYLAGNLGVSIAEAERILSEGKGAGVSETHRMAIDRAVSQTRYHVVRPKAGQQEQPQSHSRVPTQLREAAMVFLAEFEGETLTAQITAAIATLNKMR